ncbi:threonine aldolase family protein [Litchfieldella xinjiangensis]|uniref:threonine aldolase family protein n=1 Tax=Litchfieldella xinjiangensis TaxID=1166948 RepID=UPI0005BA4552|nr:low specificity L-threonine aldolase [Halomonas xinjiangensis]
MLPDCTPRFVASDNTSGICPEALEYLLEANRCDDLAYGNDIWTDKAAERFREMFDFDCEVFFVFNGTAANSLALAAMGRSYHSVICHELAHIETDECGGPEFFSNGAKLLTSSGAEGKLTPEGIEALVTRRSDIHYPKPRVVSLTQATEVGTLYSREELLAIRTMADKHDLRLHMDGARFANACVALGATPAELTWQVGVDALCFSGTKNGLAMGEAILFFNRDLAEDFAWRCKQAGQLASKMRFIAAPWLGLLESGAWRTNAEHANAMARYLADGLADMPGVESMFPTQANSVFVRLPPHAIDRLRGLGWTFYTFIGAGGARFVCAWNTTTELLDTLMADIRESLVA